MEQITIITKDYHGLTADITSALGSNDINIESLDAKKIDDIGLVMLRVNQYDRALSILRDAGWNAITEDALLVRVKDEPGAIAHLAKRCDATSQLLRPALCFGAPAPRRRFVATPAARRRAA